MRFAALLLAMVCPLPAQFKSTVPLVVAPTAVTDAKGRTVDGLTERDLIFYDNNVPRAIQVETVSHPISLAVLVQSSVNSSAILDKLGRSGILFSELLAANAGETALLTFSGHVKLLQDFTGEPDKLTKALRNLRSQGNGAALLDGIHESLRALEARDRSRRRVLLVIAERRDRSSKLDLAGLLREAELQNTA
ncbi:MAG TPA: VWA domain-containing protein, partial [Bryobacteraceae bacterium]